MEIRDIKQPVIELRDVTIASLWRPDVPEIGGINWQIRPGDFWIIGGFHGAGKSDLLATVAALQRPLHGTVTWFGRDIWELKEHELIEDRLRIGMVFENGGRIFRHLTVAENIALPIRYHRNQRLTQVEAEVETLLEVTGLRSRASAIAGTMGLAWQQRVALARALALKPEVLILDKPLMGVGHLGWWTEFLGQLSTGKTFIGRPVTLVMTTDDLPRWLDYGRQFALLKKNRWHVLGEKAELPRKETLLGELWVEDVNL